MSDDRDEMIQDVVVELQRPTRVSASFDERVMAAVRSAPKVRRLGAWGRLMIPRTITLTPLPSALLAASLVVVAALGGVMGTREVARRQARSDSIAAVAATATREVASGPRPVQFVLVAPDAKKVAVAGDFNDWNPSHADFIAHHQGGGVWALTARIPAGHHRYSFVVDDTMWVADPTAARVVDPDFGQPASALVVGESDE